MLDLAAAAHSVLGASLLATALTNILARFRRPSPADRRPPRLTPCSRPAGGHPAHHPSATPPAGGDVSRPATYTIDRSVAYRARLRDHHRSMTQQAATCLRLALRLRILRGIDLQRHLAEHGRLPYRPMTGWRSLPDWS